jgi:hypothetical protein
MLEEAVGRVCTGCGTSKPLSEYVKSKTQAKDGYTYRCKECISAYTRKKYAEDPERRRKWKEYAQSHPKEKTDEARARERELSKKRRDANPEKFREKNRKWFRANPDKVKEYHKRYSEKPKIECLSKICSKCHAEKPAPDFRRSKSSKDGRQSWCKKCQNADQQSRYRGDSDFRKKRILKSTQWAKNNPDKHRESVRRARRKWYDGNKDKVRRYCSGRRARIIGNGGSHTAEDWKNLCEKYDNCCLRCGEQENLTEDHIVSLFDGGTDDIENIQPLCKKCNSSKREKSIDYRPEWDKK